MIHEIIRHFSSHTKPYCVFGVLNNDLGREIESGMLKWLVPEYDVISIIHDGTEYEYPALRYLQDLCRNTKECALYLHTKGAANPSEFQNKVINLWRDEFVNHKYDYIRLLDSYNVVCPFTGVCKYTWYNGFFVSAYAAINMEDISFTKNRYFYETMFKHEHGITVYGRVYSDVDNSSTDFNTPSKKRMRFYVSNLSNNDIYLTFTTWKDRIEHIEQFVDNLKHQTIKPKKCICWLSSDELSEDDVPIFLKNSDFVEIKWVKENLKSFKKFLTIKEFPNAYNIIVDDDRLYSSDIIDVLLKESKKYDDKSIISYYCDICNSKGQPWGGVNGEDTTKYKWINDSCVLYPPNTFPMEVFDYFDKIMLKRPLISDECFIMPFLIYQNSVLNSIGTFCELNKKCPILTYSLSNALHKKFFTLGSDTKTNKKNQLIWDICQELPIEYYNSYKEAFPNFGSDIEVKDRIIISMTTWSERIKNLPIILEAVMANTKLPDKIVINVSIEDFPNGYESFPKEVMVSINKYKSFLDICWLKHNTKVWKKLIPTLLRYNSDNDIIISIDDDFKYPNDFIETLYNDYVRYGKKIPISGNNAVIKGTQYHCGCCSLTKYAFFKDNLGLLTPDVYNVGSDDVYYTAVVNRGGRNYKKSSNLYFNNMSLISSNDIGYSASNKIDISNAISTCSKVKESDYTYSIIDYICEPADNKYEYDSAKKIEIAVIDNSNNTKTKEERVGGNRLLVLIEKSQYNPILSEIYNSFSELYDTKIIDCPNRNYVKCYKELSGYSKLYDWILLLKSNVSFEWASSKYFKTIIKKLTNITYRSDVGLFGLNNSYNADGVITGGEIKTIITQDQFVLINTKVIDECGNVVFSNDMGFGYIDYLSKISNRIGLSTIMCLDIPMRTYTNIENYDNPTVSDYRKKFMKDNPL